MKKRFNTWRGVVGCGCLSLMISHARAVIPMRADVPTEASTHAQYGKFHAQVARESYQRVGVHNHDLDAEVEQYVADVASCSGNVPPAPLTWVSLERRGRELYIRGSDDPLLRFMYGVSLVSINCVAMAEPFVSDAPEALTRQGYSPIFRLIAARNACRLLIQWGRQNEIPKYADMLVGATADLLNERAYANQRGLLLQILQDTLPLLNASQLQNLWQRAAKIQSADPVAVLYLEGEFHAKAGYEHRGDGYAATVTEEGWKGLEKESAEATRCFTKAWEMDHSVPQPAARMVGVSLASKGKAAMRTWFDRAVEARFDDASAFSTFIYGLYPRWHGDRQTLLDFGDECAATERFDTNVPFRYFEILQVVNRECDASDGRVWRDPEIYEKVRQIIDKTLAAGGQRGRESYLRSEEAALAVRSGHWDDARAIVEKIQEPLNGDATEEMRLTIAEVKGAARAYAGPHAAEALKARDLAIAGDEVGALAGYRAALAANPDPEAKAFLASRIQILKWQTDFATGAPVPIKATPELYGFNVLCGNWQAEPDGGVIGICTFEEMVLVCEANFENNWDLSVDIDFLRTSPDWDASGIALCRPGDTSYLDFALNPKKKDFTVRFNRYEEQVVVPATVAAHNVMTVKRRGTSIVISVNGQEIHRDRVPIDHTQLSFGGWPLYINGKVAFRNMAITKSKG